MTDLATLQLAIDATQVKSGIESLKALTEAGKAAEGQMQKVTTASLMQAESMRALSREMTQTTRTLKAALDSIQSGHVDVDNTVKKTSSSVVNSHAKMGASALQVRESLVIMREAAAGNFTRMAGSASILAGSFGLMTGSALLTGAAIAALAAPFVALGVAMVLGYNESIQFQKGLALTGFYARVTSEDVDRMARTVATSTATGFGSAQRTFRSLAESGLVTGKALENMGAAAIKLGDLTGKSATKIADGWAKMADEPVKLMKELDRQYHFLSESERNHIRELTDEGDKTAATAALFKAFNVEIANQTAHFGWLDQAIHGAANALGGLWANMKAIGAAPSVGSALQAAQHRLSLIQQSSGSTSYDGHPIDRAANLRSAQAEVARLQAEVAEEEHKGRVSANRKLAEDLHDAQEIQLKGIRSDKELADRKKREYRATNQAILSNPESTAEDKKTAAWALSTAEQKALDANIDKRYAGRVDGPRVGHAGAGREESFAAGTASIEAQAAGELKVAAAYSVSADAVLKEEAAMKANAAVLKDRVKLSDAVARVKADENKLFADGVLSEAKAIDKLERHNDAQRLVNDQVKRGVVASQDASKEVTRQVQLSDLQETALGKTAAQIKIVNELVAKLKAAWADADQQQVVSELNATTEALRRESKQLDDELAVMKETNRERDIEIAQIKERNRLLGMKNGAALVASPEGQAAIKAAGSNAGKASDLSLKNSLTTPQQLGVDEAHSAAKQANQDISFLTDKKARYRAAYAEIGRMEQAGVVNHQTALQAKRNLDLQYNAERLQDASNILGALAGLASSKSKELKEIGKTAALAQAMIDGYSAINTALAAPPGWPYNAASVATVTIMQAANVAKIAGFKEGGKITGEGGPKDDRIPIMASNGEFMVNADATKRHLPWLEAINSGRMDMNDNGFAQGGIVGATPIPMAVPGPSQVSSAGGGINLDFRGANFGGADPAMIEQRFRKIVREEVAPNILAQARRQAATDVNNKFSRQKLNR